MGIRQRARAWLLLAALGTAALVGGCGDEAPSSSDTAPVGAPGDPLADGLVVPASTVQIAPIAFDLEPGSFERWTAVVSVTGEPLDAWRSFLEQLGELAPESALDPENAHGCRRPEYSGDPVCEMQVQVVSPDTGEPVVLFGTLATIESDVTGSYLLTIRGLPGDLGSSAPGPRFELDPEDLPPAAPARQAPEPGDPLAASVAYPGDEERYVLLDGSTLVAQYGEGSITGGFDVILRVADGTDALDLAEQYAEQATQFDGEETRTGTAERDGIIYTTFMPPGGAGGYQGHLTLIEDPAGPDFIYYRLAND